MTNLAVSDIRKRYGGVTALAGASFAIDRPGIYGLIGPNGAGKTTLFDVIAGTTSADTGRVTLADRDVTGAAPHRLAAQGLARSFQECRVLSEFSCLDNLLFAAQPKSLRHTVAQAFMRRNPSRAASLTEARRLLDLVNLSAYAEAPASVLSFGQRRLLEIVATFMRRPTVLLLDEPAAGVNPALLATLTHALRAMFTERPGVFLIVEHNMAFILELADEIIVMHQGAVLERGTPAAIQASPRVLEAYLG
jgi:ABC-type branched-subunit amino acid transport system ATPase component